MLEITPLGHAQGALTREAERTYRGMSAFQWARELVVNSIEANAKRIDLDICWPLFEAQGRYCRVCVDDGDGMTEDQLRSFMSEWGGSGKPIGGVHENFGIGSKAGCLPWNRSGMIVVSRAHGETSGVWLVFSPETGNFGMRRFHYDEGETTEVFPVYEDDEDEELEVVLYDLISDPKTGERYESGTAVLLLGNEDAQHTALGDPQRPDEAAQKGITQYLNKRFLDLPDGVRLRVTELPPGEPDTWPKKSKYSGRGSFNRRMIEGTRKATIHAKEMGDDSVETGELDLGELGRLEWALRHQALARTHAVAYENGFFAWEYKGELFNVRTDARIFQTLGVPYKDVFQRLFVIVHPPHHEEKSVGFGGRRGVYQLNDRSRLIWSGGQELPIEKYAAHWFDNLPPAVEDALKAHRKKTQFDEDEDEKIAQSLLSRFRDLWKRAVGLMDSGGSTPVTPRKKVVRRRESKKRTKKRNTGPKGVIDNLATSGAGAVVEIDPDPGIGSQTGRLVKMPLGLPKVISVSRSDLSNPWELANWKPPTTDADPGEILLAVDHPIITEETSYWQSQYPRTPREDLEQVVVSTVKTQLLAVVAHTQGFTRGTGLTEREVDSSLRSPGALTAAVCGGYALRTILGPRMGRFGRRRKDE